MPKKEEKKEGDSNWLDVLMTNAFSIIREVFFQGVVERVHEEAESLMDKAQMRAEYVRIKFKQDLDDFQREFMQNFTFRVLLIAGVLFISIGIVYGLIDILHVQRIYSFVFMGLVLLVSMFFYKKYIDIKKRLREGEHAKEEKQ